MRQGTLIKLGKPKWTQGLIETKYNFFYFVSTQLKNFSL